MLVVRAADFGVAAVCCARVVVVAVDEAAGTAEPLRAPVIVCAQTAILALAIVGRVGASRFMLACVVGARIVVVASHWFAAIALPLSAPVTGRAGVRVIARRGVEQVSAAQRRITVVIGAHIAVIARAGITCVVSAA